MNIYIRFFGLLFFFVSAIAACPSQAAHFSNDELNGTSVLSDFIDLAKNERLSSYRHLINFFRTNEQKTESTHAEVYQQIARVLTREKHVSNDLVVRYFPGSDELWKEADEIYLYHGTRATADILIAGKLEAHVAKCRRYGIFFGRTFYDSQAYLSDVSSNIHKTWTSTILRSILIFRKDDNYNFQRTEAGWDGSVKEYHLNENEYSTKNLQAIYFPDENNALLYQKFLANSRDLREKYKDVEIYVETYHPLSHAENLIELQTLLLKHQSILFNDPFFIAFLATEFPVLTKLHSTFFEKQSSRFDPMPEILGSALMAAAAKTKNSELFAAVISKVSPRALVTSQDYRDSPFESALRSKDKELLGKILTRISTDVETMQSAATILYRFFRGSIAHGIFEQIAQYFSAYDEVMHELLVVIAENPDDDVARFQKLFKLGSPNTIFARRKGAKSIANCAAQEGNKNILRFVVGVNKEILLEQDVSGRIPLSYLAERETDFDIFQDVYKAMPSTLKVVDHHRSTIAHFAAGKNNVSVLKLIQQEAPIYLQAQDLDQCTPLTKAVREKANDAVAFLIAESPASLSLRDRWKWTPITSAANNNNFVAIELISKAAPKIVEEEFVTTMERIDLYKYAASQRVLKIYFPHRF